MEVTVLRGGYSTVIEEGGAVKVLTPIEYERISIDEVK